MYCVNNKGDIMAEFSLDVNEIKEEVEKDFEEQKESLPNDEIKKQADENAVAIFDTDFDDVTAREAILKPLDDFGLNAMNRSANKNKLLESRFSDIARGGDEATNVGNK